MKITDNETRWAKIGNINHLAFIGKETVIYGSGCHLIFINMSNSEELLYTANTIRKGDGIQCFCGNRTQNVFAFAEKRTNGAIFIKTYPNFEDVCYFKDNDNGWIQLEFSETSLLVSAGDLPNFNITIWNWRRGEKIATQNSGIMMREQFLKCNYGSPVLVAQLGLNSDKLHLWDIYVCGKKSILTEHTVTIEENFITFTKVLWTSENALLVLDTAGCVYIMYPDHHLERIIDCDVSGSEETSFVWHKSGIVIYGPNVEIRHYKKSGTWNIDWRLTPIEPIKRLFSRYDHLVAITQNNNIIEISSIECKYIKQRESNFNSFCIIYPTGEYIMSLSYGTLLNLFKVETGEKVSSLELDDQAIVMTENPKFPYAALGFQSGNVKLISVYTPEKLTNLTSFYLTKNPIEHIVFNECGTIFVASNFLYGRFFVIEGLPGGQMKIVATVDVKNQIADLMMILSENCYRIFIIPVTSKEEVAGNVVWRFCIIKNKSVELKEYLFEEKNVWFKGIVPISGHNRHRVFYLIPKAGKTIAEVQIEKGEFIAKINRRIVTGHQLRGINFKIIKNVALTWGYDGFVIARSSDFSKNIGMCLSHHRYKAGVFKTQIDPHNKYIISLGCDNVLVCTNLMENQIDPEYKQELEDLYNSSDFKLLFSRHTIGFQPKGKYEGKCYLDVEELQKTETERIKCELEKQAILQEFRAIQKELQELLTENLEGPDNEKLDIIEFNLNVKLFEEQSEKHKILRKATEVYLRKVIERQNEIFEYMMEQFWNKMQVHGTVMMAIFQRFEVYNYALQAPDLNREERLEFIKHLRTLENYLGEMKPFRPWEPMPEETLLALVNSRPALPLLDKHIKVLSTIELDVAENEEEENQDDIETKIAFFGSDVAKFIELNEIHYYPDEIKTYGQTEIQWIVSKKDCYILKEFFNERFDKLMIQKIKEMDNIFQKNNRLRHIVSELNYFSDEKISMIIEDPEWKQIENPELLTQVKDNEVPITPYISPSEQAILDAKAAEEERIRLLLLADDFRERALMAMMNGVLEIRWEDELKKDVPLPKCMMEKEPENYNEEDLKAVRDYEEKVKFLNSERERYKLLLRTEYGKLSQSVRESIKKFNGRLNDLLRLKLSVDACLSQENLKINRSKLFQTNRKRLVRKEQEIIKKIAENDEIISSLQKLMHTLHDSVFDIRNYLETYQAKEKILERAYKKDFQDMPIVIQEQATKLLKKRPKINFKAITSSTILNELGKHILSGSKPPPSLPNDCFEFLKQLDLLDMYVGIPSLIDEHTYALICKHRRLKVEYEIKLKAAQTELAEGENTSAAFHKRLQQKKEFGAKLHNDLTEVRQEILTAICDSDVQIVLPRGLVEIPLTGHLNDFHDAILICRNVVENINKIILEFGDKKIKALQKAMTFRRKILKIEWEHKRMKMLIQDLEEKLIDIDNVRLTKELQFHLKSRDKDKAIPFEIEVDMIKASYENTIQDRKDKVNRMKKQIKAIKTHDEATEKKIQEINVDVCEFNLARDKELDEKERTVVDTRIKTLLQRSKLVQLIQDNHHEILMLQTELELLRLKTFPTLKYKTV